MIVYIESNFILELAYLQEKYESCERILSLAEDGLIQVALPAMCIAEPYSNWIARNKRRNGLHGELTRELKELGRSRPYTSSHEEFQEITKLLNVSGKEEKERLDLTLSRVLEVSMIIPIDREVTKAAIDFQLTRDLEPHDSILYASVLSNLKSSPKLEPKCFVTKDSKDFFNPDVVADLMSFGCELSTSFGAAYGLILKHTQSSRL